MVSLPWTAGTVHCILQGHGGAINDMRFHPQERALLLSASADESIRLWHIGARCCLATFAGHAGHLDSVVSLDVRLDGGALASGSIDGSVKVWALDTPELAARVTAANQLAASYDAAVQAVVAATSSSCQDAGGAEGGEPDALEAARPSCSQPLPPLPPCPEDAPPPLVIQWPRATYNRVHYDSSAGLSYWVDCVRFVGNNLLSRSSNGRAVLWEEELATGSNGRSGVASNHGSLSSSQGNWPSGRGDASGNDAANDAAADASNSCGGSSGSRDRRAELEKLPVHRTVAEFYAQGTEGIWFLKFGLDGKRSRLAVGNMKGETALWDLSQVVAPASDGNGSDHARDGNICGVTTGAEGRTSSSSVALQTPDGCVAPVTKVRLPLGSKATKSKKGKALAADNVVMIRCTSISYDASHVVCGCDDGSVCVWEL